MTKKRKTLAQKKKSLERKQQQLAEVRVSESEQGKFEYNNQELSSKNQEIKRSKNQRINKIKDDDQILVVSEKYIRRDLIKTALLSVIFTAVILGIYWYVELGGATILKLPF